MTPRGLGPLGPSILNDEPTGPNTPLLRPEEDEVPLGYESAFPVPQQENDDEAK